MPRGSRPPGAREGKAEQNEQGVTKVDKPLDPSSSSPNVGSSHKSSEMMPLPLNRTRVNFFMNKFRKLGFIHYNGGLQVHNSLLSVVLHD
jgi:hypothetical protein